MKTQFRLSGSSRVLCGLIACCAGSVSSAYGQTILAPPPAISITPPAVEQYQTNNPMVVFTPERAPETPPLRWQWLTFRPHLLYRFLHVTALPTSVTQRVESTVQELSPGLLVNLGAHWSLDYTPTLRFYSSRAFDDTLEHSVRLMGGTTYQDWTLGLLQTYEKTSQPLVETGTQTDQETFYTLLNASYQINSQMSADGALSQRIVSADAFQSSKEWSPSAWLNYQFWPRLDAGLGIAGGYVDVETGSDMAYERFQARANWRATDKLALRVHGGAELRHFLDSNADDQLNPVAGAQLQYQPFEHTRIALGVSRTVDVSLLTAGAGESQITETTEVTAQLSQRLLEQLQLQIGGGYFRGEYTAADPTVPDRKDDYFRFNARLGWRFLKRGTAAVFYQYSDLNSNFAGYGFSAHQTGFELEFRY
jgi:hypothetical protein